MQDEFKVGAKIPKFFILVLFMFDVGTATYKCIWCYTEFRNEENFNKHTSRCNNCDQCESSLRIHIQSKREGICYKCDQCEHELIC